MSEVGLVETSLGAAGATLAVIPVRAGVLPLGADETVAEAGGRAVIVGSDTRQAVEDLATLTSAVWMIELGNFAPGLWAGRCASALATTPGLTGGGHVLLPGSPDGRDLGPRLAVELGREYLAGVTRLGDDLAERPRYGGRVTDTLAVDEPVVATFQPGVRGVGPTDHRARSAAPVVIPVPPGMPRDDELPVDPVLLVELPADPSTMDLAEADRIIGGGAGLGSAEAFRRLADLAIALGASPGGTRVITDWGWLPVERQIGTTGIAVDPSLYIALGVSGAVQHTAGLGSPDHVISVNTDPHCPMMALADLAIVTDAPAFLDELMALVSGDPD